MTLWNRMHHLLENAQNLIGSAGTVYANYVSTGILQLTRHLGRIVSKQRTVVTGESHRGDYRNFSVDVAGCQNSLAQLVKVGHGLNNQEINTGGNQTLDLLTEDNPGFFWLHPAERCQPHAQWTDITGNQNILVRG